MKNFWSQFLFFCLLISLFHSQSASAQGDLTSQEFGDVFLVTLPAATMTTTLALQDFKGTWQFSKGLLVTMGVTYGLKYIVDKDRPDNSGSDSFPSAHTSAVFHSAGFVHKRYGLKYAIPSYLMAGFTGYSRIDSKKHDVFDVLAGMIIGLGSNFLFVTEYQQQHMQLTYSQQDEMRLIGFEYRF
ncbi:hypothetical protein GCM10009117_11120 [Gangjinia marincola]|uniref:Phosphatidic acid phosphatase type 2/haloperoxidase domain-containing protein n=1 Tax=Gangjinia marincola TaxID=578463 RepID=A0ABP3XRK2_9FLAO